MSELTKGLYKVRVFKNGIQIAAVKAIAWSRRDAYWDWCGDLPIHDKWDADRLREATEDEKPGRVIEKNDLKRKSGKQKQ